MGLSGRLVCSDCGEIMQAKKNGVVVKMKNYSGFFRADLFQCQKCGKQILAGFGSEYFNHEGKVDFDFRERLKMSDVKIESIDRLPFDEYYDLITVDLNIYGNALTVRTLVHHRTEKIEFVEVMKDV